MSIVPINISDAPQPETDPQICLFEVNWSHDWPSDPQKWSSIHARHINTWSFDKSYMRKYNDRNQPGIDFFNSLLTKFNVACGASALSKFCALPADQELNFIRSLGDKLRTILHSRQQRRKAEFSVATDVGDVSISKSTDYVLLLDRVKKLRPNMQNGKNCLAHPFDMGKEHKRLEEISALFKARPSIK